MYTCLPTRCSVLEGKSLMICPMFIVCPKTVMSKQVTTCDRSRGHYFNSFHRGVERDLLVILICFLLFFFSFFWRSSDSEHLPANHPCFYSKYQEYQHSTVKKYRLKVWNIPPEQTAAFKDRHVDVPRILFYVCKTYDNTMLAFCINLLFFLVSIMLFVPSTCSIVYLASSHWL